MLDESTAFSSGVTDERVLDLASFAAAVALDDVDALVELFDRDDEHA